MRLGWPHVIRRSVQIQGGNLIPTILQHFISLTPTRSAAVSVFYRTTRYRERHQRESEIIPSVLKGHSTLDEDLAMNVNSEQTSLIKEYSTVYGAGGAHMAGVGSNLAGV